MTKIVAILGGGDWSDAGVTHVVMLTETPIEELKNRWNKWYREVYITNLIEEKKIVFRSFDEWLIENGLARKTNDTEVEEFYDN